MLMLVQRTFSAQAIGYSFRCCRILFMKQIFTPLGIYKQENVSNVI